MQSEFYKAGYDETMEKLAGPFGAVGGMIGRGLKYMGSGLRGVGRGEGSAVGKMVGSESAPMSWLGGKVQGAARGLGQSFTNLGKNPGQTLWQGAGNFGKNMIGMGNAATTSGVLGRGAMGYGLLRGATSGFGNNAPPQPGNNMPTGFGNTGN